MKVEKTVFISYRRTNIYMARAVYQDLTANGYDCFLDYESIDAGSFERIILNQIAARAHFVVILTPSALERCSDPADWLRREIEYALEMKRNLVPLMFDQFSYKDVQKYLVGGLAILPQYNSLEIPPAYFEEAMARLRTRFLNKSLDVILHPTPKGDQAAVQKAQAKEAAQPAVSEEQLTAEQWAERGWKRDKTDYDGQISDYSEAIRLNPLYALAYNNRGRARDDKGDAEGAMADYNEAIRLNPLYAIAYVNRGNARSDKGNVEGAMADYNEAIRLNPHNAEAFYNRGVLYHNKEELQAAIDDYTKAIQLNPDYAEAYNNRGNARESNGDEDGGMADYNKAIRHSPKHANAYHNRGVAYARRGELKRANEDYQRYIDLGGVEADKVREWMKDNEDMLNGR